MSARACVTFWCLTCLARPLTPSSRTRPPARPTGSQCSVWCCNEAEGLCGVRGSIEGGMGYWPYTAEARGQVKFMLPGSTNGNYELFGGTFLNDRRQPCANLGGAVRISNRLLVPSDFLSFEGGESINGMFGYMLTQTPILRRGPKDDTNGETILVHAKNYAGPALATAQYFWESRVNWHPDAISWADPRVSYGYIANGFEGALGARSASVGSETYYNLTAFALPVDDDGETCTIMSGFQYYLGRPMESVLDAIMTDPAGKSPADIAAAALAVAGTPNCNAPPEDAALRFGPELDDAELQIPVEGVQPITLDDAQRLEAGCPSAFKLDPSKLDCDSKPGFCIVQSILKQGADGSVELHDEKDLSQSVLEALSANRFPPHRPNTGNFLEPHDNDGDCFEAPGPADDKMYCTRTNTEQWIGFKWYRFVDQPDLTNTFAAMRSDSERRAAKAYMQARIENLHRMTNSDSTTGWFSPAQGVGALPKDLVELDSNLLLTPPEGMEVGYVPVPVFSRIREQPPGGCDVVVDGSPEAEPNPLPSDYYADNPACDDPAFGLEYYDCAFSTTGIYVSSVDPDDEPVAYFPPRAGFLSGTTWDSLTIDSAPTSSVKAGFEEWCGDGWGGDCASECWRHSSKGDCKADPACGRWVRGSCRAAARFCKDVQDEVQCGAMTEQRCVWYLNSDGTGGCEKAAYECSEYMRRPTGAAQCAADTHCAWSGDYCGQAVPLDEGAGEGDGDEEQHDEEEDAESPSEDHGGAGDDEPVPSLPIDPRESCTPDLSEDECEAVGAGICEWHETPESEWCGPPGSGGTPDGEGAGDDDTGDAPAPFPSPPPPSSLPPPSPPPPKVKPKKPANKAKKKAKKAKKPRKAKKAKKPKKGGSVVSAASSTPDAPLVSDTSVPPPLDLSESKKSKKSKKEGNKEVKLSKKQVRKLCKKAKSKKACKKGDAKKHCTYSKKKGCTPG